MATVTELKAAARKAGKALDAAREEFVAAQAVSDAEAEAHDTLLERAYNGDDSIPWAQVKRCERDMTAAAARLDQAKAALAAAERAGADAEREATIERYTAALTDGELDKAWSRYVGYVSSAFARSGELSHVPHGRKPGQSDAEWQMQQGIDRSSDAISYAAAAELIRSMRIDLGLAIEARDAFEKAAREHSALLNEAVTVIRRYGLTDWLVSGGRGGYRHHERTVTRCDLGSSEVTRQHESIRVLGLRLADKSVVLWPPQPRADSNPSPSIRQQSRARVKVAAVEAVKAGDEFQSVEVG